MKSRKKDLQTWGAATTGAGAAVLATAASACCVPILAPLLVSVLGVSGSVWAAGLKPYSLPILALSGLSLAYGFFAVYRQRAEAVGVCSTRRPRAVRWVLWSSAILWALAVMANVVQLLTGRV